MLGLRSRAVALALVLVLALAACGGGGESDTATAGGGDTGKSDTSEPVDGDATDEGADPSAGATPDEGATDPAAGEAPAPAADPAQSGGGTDPAAPPASTAGGAPAPAAAAPTDADAMARVLRVEDLPSGYQKSREVAGRDEETSDFEAAFRKCLGVAGADASALAEPTGQASRFFTDGSPNPQNPEGISSATLGFADAGASERMLAEMGKLFASEPGRKCIAEEVRKVVDAQVKSVAPTAKTTVVATQTSTYAAGGGIAQLQLKITADLGAQKYVYYSDVIIVRAGRFAAMVGFTNEAEPFAAKLGQSIVDKAVARIAA